MLLTRIMRALRREDGVAMAAVLGLLAVGLVLTTVILTSVVSAQSYSTYTRAGVQSQAAAEAGVAAARAGLAAGTCSGANPTYASAPGAVPAYSATIWRPSGGSWVQGCPVGTSTHVRILSTGYAVAPGQAGFSAADATTVEAILDAIEGSAPLTPSGPALYAYSASAFGNGGQFLSVDGSIPDVLVKTGNVNCTGAVNGVANFVINGGNLNVGNSCAIEGNAFASGRMTLAGNGYVRGNAVANGITIDGSAKIYGRVWSSADIATSGSPLVAGILKAQSASLGGGTFSSAAYIYGNTHVTNAGGTNLGGTLTTQSATPAPPSWWSGLSRMSIVNPITAPTYLSDVPTTPTVPDWVDFGARPEDYTSAGWAGFTVYTMGSTCNQATVRAAIAAIGPNKGLIDARACSGGFALTNDESASVVDDLAIIANTITFANSGRLTSTSTHRLWLINPDTVANRAPNCPGGISISGQAEHFTNLHVMIYSGCSVTIANGTLLRGQIFAGDITLGGSAQVSYVPIGVPGYNLSTGSTESATPTSSSRPLVSLRNVTP